MIPFDTNNIKEVNHNSIPTRSKYKKINDQQINRDSRRYKPRSRFPDREFFGRRTGGHPNHPVSLSGIKSTRDVPVAPQITVPNSSTDQSLDAKVSPLVPVRVAEPDRDESVTPETSENSQHNIKSGDQGSSGQQPFAMETPSERGRPVPEPDQLNTIEHAELSQTVAMEVSEVKATSPENNSASKSNGPSKTASPVSTLPATPANPCPSSYKDTSSPPESSNGIYRCYRCQQILGDEDEVYLCAVCGSLDCDCDDNINDHVHPGHKIGDMWLAKQTLGVLRMKYNA